MTDQHVNESIEFHTKFSKIVILKKKIEKNEENLTLPSNSISFQINTNNQTKANAAHTYKIIIATTTTTTKLNMLNSIVTNCLKSTMTKKSIL